MTTFQSVLTRHNVELPEGLEADMEVPVLTGPQRQGDVGIFPRPKLGTAEAAAFVQIPATGVAVVRGELGGNTHWLNGDGPVLWQANPATSTTDLTLGIVDVPAGSVAYLIHEEEHGVNAFGPGTYRLVGKREQAQELRRVAD